MGMGPLLDDLISITRILTDERSSFILKQGCKYWNWWKQARYCVQSISWFTVSFAFSWRGQAVFLFHRWSKVSLWCGIEKSGLDVRRTGSELQRRGQQHQLKTVLPPRNPSGIPHRAMQMLALLLLFLGCQAPTDLVSCPSLFSPPCPWPWSWTHGNCWLWWAQHQSGDDEPQICQSTPFPPIQVLTPIRTP